MCDTQDHFREPLMNFIADTKESLENDEEFPKEIMADFHESKPNIQSKAETYSPTSKQMNLEAILRGRNFYVPHKQ